MAEHKLPCSSIWVKQTPMGNQWVRLGREGREECDAGVACGRRWLDTATELGWALRRRENRERKTRRRSGKKRRGYLGNNKVICCKIILKWWKGVWLSFWGVQKSAPYIKEEEVLIYREWTVIGRVIFMILDRPTVCLHQLAGVQFRNPRFHNFASLCVFVFPYSLISEYSSA